MIYKYSSYTNNNSGFTILEIISVLVIVGVLGAYVAKTSTDIIDEAETIGEINRVKLHLKYAQTKSINSSGNWGIDFSGSDNDYALFSWDGSTGITLAYGTNYYYFPGEEKNITIDEKSDCSLKMPDSSKYNSYDKLVWFDSLGRGYTSNTTTIAAKNEISTELSIVTFGANKIISIQPKTGYVKCDYK